jgi:8-hydroxy-5-deazaflavin:NADPH oxidoreductase
VLYDIMKIGILGTGAVGEHIGSALIKKGHYVLMGSRKAGHERAVEWKKKGGDSANEGSFEDAAIYGDLVFLCLNGEHALEALDMVDKRQLDGKIVIDLTNPLDFSQGMPPRILEKYHTVSLGERIQEAIPQAHVVKTLNTVNHQLMVDARLVNKGDHTLFICGNDANAKNQVKHFLVDNFHWTPDDLLDLGDIRAARVAEVYVPLWVHIWQAIGTPMFNIKVVK